MTNVEFSLPDPELEQYTWIYESEHGPASQPPLTCGRAFGPLVNPGSPPSYLIINGYIYYRADPADKAGMSASPPDLGGLTALEIWRTKWFPEVNTLFEELCAFKASDVPAGQWRDVLDRQIAEFGRVFSGVHGECVIPAGRLAKEFTSAYCDVFGSARRPDSHALLQGFPNRTLDRAVALWDLGREARADEGLLAALREAATTGTTSVGHAGFDIRFTAFLEDFGHTTERDLVDAPTWLEDPRPALGLVLRYAEEPEEASPARAVAEQVARREELESELRARAAEDAGARALLDGLPTAQQLLPVREDHNAVCDQRLAAASRYRWLNIGRLLAARAILHDSGAVFYLTFDELIDALETGSAPAISILDARRQAQTSYRAVSPPPVLGRPLPEQEGIAGVLKGIGASPGAYRGRARVIRSLTEANRLRDGDVLVCGMTAPTWTPYFALAGAVVTDAGGALSHMAIVAREYGIPAVAGTRTATREISDGAIVEVDGTEGIVRFPLSG